MESSHRLPLVAAYAVAMAYVEAAVVAYLREVYGIEDVLRDLPAAADHITLIEVGRETATLIMLLALGWLAGRCRQDRAGYCAFAFGLWDIAYYAWLELFLGWPRSLLDWDLLFLIPVPWWAPVLAPTLLAATICLCGAAAVLQVDRGTVWRLTAANVSVATAGLALVLYTFTADALWALPQGIDAVARVRPIHFRWPLFLLGFVMILWAGLRVTWPGRSRLLRT
jgi:hypothetical protein